MKRRVEGYYGSGRRRAYWEQEGGLVSQGPLSTIWSGLLTGVGVGLGLLLLSKAAKKIR